jgi:hypothetical protein
MFALTLRPTEICLDIDTYWVVQPYHRLCETFLLNVALSEPVAIKSLVF